MKRILLLLVLSASLMPLFAGVVNLSLSGSVNDLDYQFDAATGVYTLKTKGGDPYAYVKGLSRALTSDEFMLTFEYKSSTGIDELKIYFGNAYAENRSKVYGAIPRSSTWKEMSVDLHQAMVDFGWGKAGNTMRLDLGLQSGKTIELRNLRMSTGSDEDREFYLRKERLNTNLQNYLNTTYPCSVDTVEVQSARVVVSGTVPAGGQYKLVEIPLYGDVTEDTSFAFEQEIEGEHFHISLVRNASREGQRYDRLLSKWAIVDVSKSTPVLASHARYADEVKALSKPKKMELLGKKGLGGFFVNQFLSDLDELNIHSVTVNMVINTLISVKAGAFGREESFKYGNHTYYINKGSIESFDRVYQECQKRQIVTSAILLVNQGSSNAETDALFHHPECTGGYYTMPNMTTMASVNIYAAIMTYLASRYNGTGYGRINHYIMHNEVDAGKEWTNMGDQPVNIYMDAYVKSMRLVSNIVRQYDQNAAVLGSYTHTWTANSDGPGYNTKNMLGITQKYSEAEGDFWWGVAFHPYPQNLTKPCFWNDDTQSTYVMSSPYCTFKNLEVINAWVLTPQNMYQGDTKRILFLSENGTNSPDYTDAQLKNQAAGACWAWKKVNKLKGIDGIQWHNWFDNRAEFGLRIGLRRYSDDEKDPSGPKPVWYVWQAADTENEDEVFKPYLRLIGVTSWNRIFHGTLTDVEEVEFDEDADAPMQVYTLDGVLVGNTLRNLRPGVYVKRQGNRTQKVLIK